MIINSDYKPEKYITNPHWQSMWPTFLMRRKSPVNFCRERIELSDGDFIDLAWCSNNKQHPIIILLHGITGNINSPYIKYLVPELCHQQWRPVMMYYRGYSGDHNRTDVMTHAGKTDDFAEIVEILQQRYPERPIAAIGFSQGANMLLKYLGEQPQTPLKCAIAISPPFKLRNISNTVRHGMARFYQWYLLKQLKTFYRQKFQYRRSKVDLATLNSCNSFWQFDDKVTAPINGFRSATDYYQKASCINFLKHIQTPTLIIHAVDDPIMTPDVIPKEHELSPTTTLELSTYGGHLGFVTGTLFKPQFWLNQRLPSFLQQYL